MRKSRNCRICGKPSYGFRCKDCFGKSNVGKVHRWRKHRSLKNEENC